MLTRTLATIALLVGAASTAFADPIGMSVGRSIFGFVSLTDVSGLGSSESDGAASASRFQTST